MSAAKMKIDYIDMLTKSAQYASKAAGILKDMFDSGLLLEAKKAAVKKVGQDAHSHMLFLCGRLCSAFITPIDRDDIYSIASETVRITRSIDCVADRIWALRVSGVTPYMKAMADCIVKACGKLTAMISKIRVKTGKGNEFMPEINRIAQAGRSCHNEALKELFKNEKDAIVLIKINEVYTELRNALENCLDAAERVYGVIITKT